MTFACGAFDPKLLVSIRISNARTDPPGVRAFDRILPLNGRNWVSLAQLSAGVSTAPVGQPSANAGTTDSAYFAVDGVNMWQNDIRLNGINDNIEFYGGSYTGTNAAITPPPDAIQEFKLQNGNFTAEFGHSTGGIVNAVMKSGANRLHGNVWEYFRNDAMDANSYFNNLNHVRKSEYRQNQYGFTLGGPVLAVLLSVS